jgi:hypothetical protein
MNTFGGAVTTEGLILLAGAVAIAAVNAASTVHCMVTTGAGPATCFACTNTVSNYLVMGFAALATIRADPLDYGGFFDDESRRIYAWCLK